MHIVTLIVALAAGVIFLFDYAKTKSRVALGLAVITLAIILQAIIVADSVVTLSV